MVASTDAMMTRLPCSRSFTSSGVKSLSPVAMTKPWICGNDSAISTASTTSLMSAAFLRGLPCAGSSISSMPSAASSGLRAANRPQSA